jgi:fission process protein 1
MASTEITVQAAQDKVDELAERNADTTESDIRYLAYGARLRTALRAASRYVAYVRASFYVARSLTYFRGITDE